MWHGNPCPGLGQAQKMWWFKPFNGPPNIPFLIIGNHTGVVMV